MVLINFITMAFELYITVHRSTVVLYSKLSIATLGLLSFSLEKKN